MNNAIMSVKFFIVLIFNGKNPHIPKGMMWVLYLKLKF